MVRYIIGMILISAFIGCSNYVYPPAGDYLIIGQETKPPAGYIEMQKRKSDD